MELLILLSKLLASVSQGFEAGLFPCEKIKARKYSCTKWEQLQVIWEKFLVSQEIKDIFLYNLSNTLRHYTHCANATCPGKLKSLMIFACSGFILYHLDERNYFVFLLQKSSVFSSWEVTMLAVHLALS